MSSKNNIENIFKESFESFTVKPSNTLWTKINRKLIIRDYFRFNPGKFNFYYTLLIIAGASLITANINFDSNRSENILTAENHKTVINNAQDSNTNNSVISDVENDDQAVNNVTNNSELNIEENKDKTKIELHNITDQTDYNTEVNTNNGEEQKNNISLKPYADFSPSNSTACAPAAITFKNASENCDRYLWDFGNGKTSSLKHPTFVFRTAGKYTVRLTVYSGSIFHTVSKQITVNKKPNANILLKDKKNLFTNEVIHFINTSSDLYRSIWSFGDGNKSSSTHSQHEYDAEGCYKVSLICHTEKDCADTAYLNKLEIKDEKYKITARYIVSQNIPFSPKFNYDLSEYQLRIFSSNGVKVFESNDPDYKWNGYDNNPKPNEMSVFLWVCTGKFTDGVSFKQTGNITYNPPRN